MKRTPLKRKTPLRPVSRKRRQEAAARQQVRERTLRRAGYQCEAAARVPEVECWGPLDVDEKVSRGAAPGVHLDARVTQTLCRGHHEWKHQNPVTAHARGLLMWRWEYDQLPPERPSTTRNKKR